MPRNPKVIAAELGELHEKANKAFVPVNVVNALALQVEFLDAVVATLDAAGLLSEAPADDAQQG